MKFVSEVGWPWYSGLGKRRYKINSIYMERKLKHKILDSQDFHLRSL